MNEYTYGLDNEDPSGAGTLVKDWLEAWCLHEGSLLSYHKDLRTILLWIDAAYNRSPLVMDLQIRSVVTKFP